MKTATQPDLRPALLLWMGALAGAFVLALLLSHGTTGGDEGGVLQFLAVYRNSGWSGLVEGGGNHNFLAHRILWLGEKLAWEELLRLVMPQTVISNPSQYNYFMVLDDTLFMLGAFWLAARHFTRLHGPVTGFLAPAALMIASSGIGLFAGGFSECLMCLLVVVMATQLDRNDRLPTWRFCLLVISGLCLVASKLYAAPFVLALALLVPGRRKFFFFAIFLVAPIAWLVFQSEIRASDSSGMMNFYVSLMSGRSAGAFVSDVAAFVLSLSFGILPCFPLILLAALCRQALRTSLLIKIAALCGVAALLLPFPYWAGPGGLAGPRYIYPFLLILLPEIADGMRNLAARPQLRKLLLVVPLATVAFLPSLEYRNSLAGRYAGSTTRVKDLPWPHAEAGMHPAVFAWSVVTAKALALPYMHLSTAMSLDARTQDIFPMTTLSRMIYVLSFEGASPPEIQAVKDMLARHGVEEAWPWEILRLLLAMLLVGSLTIVAWPRTPR